MDYVPLAILSVVFGGILVLIMKLLASNWKSRKEVLELKYEKEKLDAQIKNMSIATDDMAKSVESRVRRSKSSRKHGNKKA